MSFRRKLSELGTPLGGASGGGSREATLEALRARMESMLGAPEIVVRAPPRDAAKTRLPFMEQETEHGPFLLRSETLPASHHVGRMPTSAACAVSPELLSLLALDPALASVDSRRLLYLDLETTGLGMGAGIIPFLVGIGWFEEGSLRFEQLLLRSPAEEAAALSHLHQRMLTASGYVSFNGKAFDLPLLEGRMVMHQLSPCPRVPHLDLLHVARRLHRARLGGCRLINLESEVLGFVRGPDVEGAEIPARYGHFLRTGDEEALSLIIEHNALDVCSMAALLGLYGEPLTGLSALDLVSLARTFHRAKAKEHADRAIEQALERGAGTPAVRLRAQIAKARGDRARALLDFETLLEEQDDPAIRLELAKLYEHHAREPLKALDLTLLGTGEAEEASRRRVERLSRKIERAKTKTLARKTRS